MVRLTAMAAVGLLLVAPCAFAQEIDDQQTMKPLHAVSADFGQRHFVSFFQAVAQHCDLTVMSATRMDERAETAPDDIQRLRVVVNPASFARVDAPNAGVLQFACSADALHMTMTVLHRLAKN